MSQPSEAVPTLNSTIGPSEEKEFVYVGEQIPNQVLIQNTGDSSVQYWMTSGDKTWRYYDVVDSGRTHSVLVQWFSGRATFRNEDGTSSITVGGDGIFPYDPVTSQAVKD